MTVNQAQFSSPESGLQLIDSISDTHIGARHAAIKRVPSEDDFWQERLHGQILERIRQASEAGAEYHLVLNGDILEFVVPSREQLKLVLNEEERELLKERTQGEDKHEKRTEYALHVGEKFVRDLHDLYVRENPHVHLHVTLGNHDAANEYWSMLQQLGGSADRLHVHDHMVQFGQLTLTHGDTLYDTNIGDIARPRRLHPMKEMWKQDGFTATTREVARLLQGAPPPVREDDGAVSGGEPVAEIYGKISKRAQRVIDGLLNTPAKVAKTMVANLKENSVDIYETVRHLVTGHVHTPHSDLDASYLSQKLARIHCHNTGTLTHGGRYNIARMEVDNGIVLDRMRPRNFPPRLTDSPSRSQGR